MFCCSQNFKNLLSLLSVDGDLIKLKWPRMSENKFG